MSLKDKDVDRIADTVVGATENIKGANEEIREVSKALCLVYQYVENIGISGHSMDKKKP